MTKSPEEIPLHALFKPTSKSVATLGGPFDIQINQVPLPLSTPSNEMLKTSVVAPGYAAAVLIPHMGGYQWWLMLSLRYQTETPPEAHHELLAHTERCTPHHPVWLGPVRASFWWRNKERLKLFRCPIPSSLLEPLWQSQGPPDGPAYWLAQRLLPRSIPGAFRLLDPYIQLWLKL